MMNCWIIGKTVVRSAHRAVRHALRRVHHQYHSPAAKILVSTMVCVSTGASLAPWLASTAPPSAHPVSFAQSQVAMPLQSSALPVGGGIFVSGATAFPLTEITLPPNLFEIPPELMATVAAENVIPPSLPASTEKSQSVPEPSSCFLLSAAIGFLALGRRLRPGGRTVSPPPPQIIIAQASTRHIRAPLNC